MGTLALQSALLDILRSEEALAQYTGDPATLAERHGLSDEERARLAAKDMGWLYVQGIPPYILAQFALTIRYDMKEYSRQVREATGYAR